MKTYDRNENPYNQRKKFEITDAEAREKITELESAIEEAEDGITYTPVIGTVETLSSDSEATASIEINEDEATATFNFGIPKGADGSDATDDTELQARIGVYIPTSSDSTSQIYSAETGETTATFDASTFMSTYDVSATDLIIDVSAQTSDGDVVYYNNIVVSDVGIVTITFDELTETTTFICKCSTM